MDSFLLFPIRDIYHPFLLKFFRTSYRRRIREPQGLVQAPAFAEMTTKLFEITRTSLNKHKINERKRLNVEFPDCPYGHSLLEIFAVCRRQILQREKSILP